MLSPALMLVFVERFGELVNVRFGAVHLFHVDVAVVGLHSVAVAVTVPVAVRHLVRFELTHHEIDLLKASDSQVIGDLVNESLWQRR